MSYERQGSRRRYAASAVPSRSPPAANLWTKAVSSTSGTISASVAAHGTDMYRVAAGTGSSTGTTTP